MAELVDRTGVPKTTILYYLCEGLLPPPERPFPNQALYGREHIERLQLITEVRQTYHFPLAKIRSLLRMVDQGASPAAVARLNERMFGPRGGEPVSERRWTLAEFCEETALAEPLVRRALDAQLLNPFVRGGELEFDSADVEIGDVLGSAPRLGLAIDDLQFIVGHARAIADGEMALRERVVAARPLDQEIELTTELTEMARKLHTYIVDRMFIATATRQRLGGKTGS